MAIIRKRNAVRSQSASVSGDILINNTSWTFAGGTVTSQAASVSGTGTVTVTPGTTYIPPSWATIPTLTFNNGTASSKSVTSYLTEGSEEPITLSAVGSLPPGVTFNATTQMFVYDGTSQAELPVESSVYIVADDAYGNDEDVTTLVVREAEETAGMVFPTRRRAAGGTGPASTVSWRP